jgi:hypothetical protein
MHVHEQSFTRTLEGIQGGYEYLNIWDTHTKETMGMFGGAQPMNWIGSICSEITPWELLNHGQSTWHSAKMRTAGRCHRYQFTS